MTKLEQKLVELGYELYCIKYLDNKIDAKIYIKQFVFCKIEVTYFPNIKLMFTIKPNFEEFKLQIVIDNLQKAFNEMQKDLEIIKECEE